MWPDDIGLKRKCQCWINPDDIGFWNWRVCPTSPKLLVSSIVRSVAFSSLSLSSNAFQHWEPISVHFKLGIISVNFKFQVPALGRPESYLFVFDVSFKLSLIL